MLTESVVVVILTPVIAYLYLRRGQRGYALAVLPVGVLPLVYLMGCVLCGHLGPLTPLTDLQWQVLFLFLGLAAGAICEGVVSYNIKRASARRGYIILCGGFTALFAFAILHAIIPVV